MENPVGKVTVDLSNFRRQSHAFHAPQVTGRHMAPPPTVSIRANCPVPVVETSSCPVVMLGIGICLSMLVTVISILYFKLWRTHTLPHIIL